MCRQIRQVKCVNRNVGFEWVDSNAFPRSAHTLQVSNYFPTDKKTLGYHNTMPQNRWYQVIICFRFVSRLCMPQHQTAEEGHFDNIMNMLGFKDLSVMWHDIRLFSNVHTVFWFFVFLVAQAVFVCVGHFVMGSLNLTLCAWSVLYVVLLFDLCFYTLYLYY